MKFYRRLQPFKVISFDLDDTLYSNAPIMERTERQMTAFFHQYLSHLPGSFDYAYWLPYRQQVLAHSPELIHDVGALRQTSYALGLQTLGYAHAEAQALAAKAQAHFDHHRSDFSVPESSHNLLKSLQKRYNLVAISNGNVCTHKIGLKPYFSHVYHAGKSGKHKPYADMFIRACKDLNITPHELLHVGDCGNADVFGAHVAGCQTVWVNQFKVGKPIKVLPHIELSDVTQLDQLT